VTGRARARSAAGLAAPTSRRHWLALRIGTRHPSTSATSLGSIRPHLAGTGLTPAASAPGVGSPRPHLRREWGPLSPPPHRKSAPRLTIHVSTASPMHAPCCLQIGYRHASSKRRNPPCSPLPLPPASPPFSSHVPAQRPGVHHQRTILRAQLPAQTLAGVSPTLGADVAGVSPTPGVDVGRGEPSATSPFCGAVGSSFT
jgi:hypothetical protein